MEFTRNTACRDCPLWEGCKSVCVPTRPYKVGPVLKPVAVLVVGKAPSTLEDQADKAYAGGPATVYLENLYLDHMKIPEKADVYLANAVRCRLPAKTEPTRAQLWACSQYLAADLELLSQSYERVIVLVTGGAAARTLGFNSLTEALNNQGVEKEIPTDTPKSDLGVPVDKMTVEDFMDAQNREYVD